MYKARNFVMKDKTINRTPIGKKLWTLRNAKGLRQKDVAEAVGIKEANYRKYETVSKPNDDALIKLADFFGVTTDYLLGKTDHKFGEEKKIITYSEKDKDLNYVIRHPHAEIKIDENGAGKLSILETLMVKKIRRISAEDRNDVIKYLNSKKDMIKE